MKKIKNVLVTDANYKHTLGIVRQLGKKGFNVYVLSFRKFSLSSFSKFCKKELIINRDFSMQELILLCKKNNIDFILLVGTESFIKIAPWKEYLEKNKIGMVVVEKDKLDLAFSKKATYNFAESIGIPVPKTIYPKTFKDIENIKIDYPCVIKGLYESGINIVDYAHSKEELLIKYKEICKKYNFTEDKNNLPLIQEYIEGFGCAFFAVYNNGKCGYTFQHKRIREWPVTGGASVCAESFKNKLIEYYGKKLLDKLKWHGVAMVEFKMKQNGIPILMEINPKFWGSTDLSLEAGVDFPGALIKIYEGKQINFSKKYKYPFKYHWPLHGDILHGIAYPKNFFKVLKDCFNPKVASNIWLEDFKPTFVMLVIFFIQLIKYVLGTWRK